MNFTIIKRSLSSRHINVPDDWITACIDWLQDNQEPDVEITHQVYQQWLASDLQELSSVSLPPNMKEKLKTTLQGYFALQINSIVDVSKPSYQQLTKLKGTDISNAEVTAERPFEPQNRISSKRMLMLDLTDGTQSIRGMEYQAIPILEANLPPGSKILIHGDIPCRLGVLLLKKENVELLGGAVDELLDKFSQCKILERRLEILDVESVNHPTLTTRDNRQPMPARVENDVQSDVKHERQKPKLQQLPLARKTITEDEDADKTLDDYIDNMFDDDDFIFQNVDLANISSGKENAGVDQNTTPKSHCSHETKTSKSVSSCNRNSNFEPPPKKMMLKTSAPLGDPPDRSDVEFPDDFGDEAFEEFVLNEEKNMQTLPLDLKLTANSNQHLRIGHTVNKLLDGERKIGNFPLQQRTSVTKMAQSTSDRETVTKERCHTTPAPTPEAINERWFKENNTNKFDTLEKTRSQPNQHVALSHHKAGSSQVASCQADVIVESDNIWTGNADVAPKLSAPFTYLCHLPKLPTGSLLHFRIKGFVMCLANRLQSNEKGWELEVELNDGSASISALMTNKLLVREMGMTVEENMQMKLSKDPVLKKKRVKIVETLCGRLYKLSCLIDLEILPGNILPNIVGFDKVNEETLRQLILRAY